MNDQLQKRQISKTIALALSVFLILTNGQLSGQPPPRAPAFTPVVLPCRGRW